MLVDGDVDPGRRSVVWSGTDATGAAVASGVYYCRLTTPEGEQSIKLTVLK